MRKVRCAVNTVARYSGFFLYYTGRQLQRWTSSVCCLSRECGQRKVESTAISEMRRCSSIVSGGTTLRVLFRRTIAAACCYFLPTAVDEQRWSSGQYAPASALNSSHEGACERMAVQGRCLVQPNFGRRSLCMVGDASLCSG